MRDAIEQFRTAIHDAGLTPPEVVEPDGKLHRFPSNGKRKDDAGCYVFHDDDLQAGAFGDWRTGASVSWRADVGRERSPQEDAAHRARVEAMRCARDAEEERHRTEARTRAGEIWHSAPPAARNHPYLVSKGVATHGLRLPTATTGTHLIVLSTYQPGVGDI